MWFFSCSRVVFFFFLFVCVCVCVLWNVYCARSVDGKDTPTFMPAKQWIPLFLTIVCFVLLFPLHIFFSLHTVLYPFALCNDLWCPSRKENAHIHRSSDAWEREMKVLSNSNSNAALHTILGWRLDLAGAIPSKYRRNKRIKTQRKKKTVFAAVPRRWSEKEGRERKKRKVYITRTPESKINSLLYPSLFSFLVACDMLR